MDKKSKYKDDYSLRTLAYYQREGGVYNELITILQRIRAEKGNGRIRAPHVILNLASEALDDCMWIVDEKGLIYNDLGESFYQLRRTLFDETGFLWMHVNDNFEDKDIEQDHDPNTGKRKICYRRYDNSYSEDLFIFHTISPL